VLISLIVKNDFTPNTFPLRGDFQLEVTTPSPSPRFESLKVIQLCQYHRRRLAINIMAIEDTQPLPMDVDSESSSSPCRSILHTLEDACSAVDLLAIIQDVILGEPT
jgi:hypothetical protein